MADLMLLLEHPGWLFGIAVAVSLAVGSFLNVVILRLPPRLEARWAEQCREMLETASPAPPPRGLVASRSYCPKCGSMITWWQNVPVVSYLLLRGRCARCEQPISWRYPVIEAATAVLSVIVLWQLGPGWPALAACVLTWGLIALTVIDVDHQLLPDSITLPGLWLGLLINTQAVFAPLADAVIGAAAGYGVLWLVYHAFRLLTGKEGMGYGDFKLLAALGAWLGWQALPLIVLLSALVGAMVGIAMIVLAGRERGQPMPFGPFLAAAGWIALLWGDEIVDAYLRFSGLGA